MAALTYHCHPPQGNDPCQVHTTCSHRTSTPLSISCHPVVVHPKNHPWWTPSTEQAHPSPPSNPPRGPLSLGIPPSAAHGSVPSRSHPPLPVQPTESCPEGLNPPQGASLRSAWGPGHRRTVGTHPWNWLKTVEGLLKAGRNAAARPALAPTEQLPAPWEACLQLLQLVAPL